MNNNETLDFFDFRGKISPGQAIMEVQCWLGFRTSYGITKLRPRFNGTDEEEKKLWEWVRKNQEDLEIKDSSGWCNY